METWVLPALMGLGLAASTGLRTFLPLLMLAVAARFGLFGVTINPHVQWLASNTALVALGAATVVELAADKIPIVDHGLAVVGTVTRPLAGALAAGAVFSHLDPTTAAIAGLIIGVPTALTFHAAQSGTRAVSTMTTAGLANPFISLVEDGVTAVLAGAALILPALAGAVALALLLVLVLGGGAILRRLRSRARTSTT
ncbi:MAG: DUF4126 domain-containing protein [Caulobacteraceae bacterium]